MHTPTGQSNKSKAMQNAISSDVIVEGAWEKAITHSEMSLILRLFVKFLSCNGRMAGSPKNGVRAVVVY